MQNRICNSWGIAWFVLSFIQANYFTYFWKIEHFHTDFDESDSDYIITITAYSEFTPKHFSGFYVLETA